MPGVQNTFGISMSCTREMNAPTTSAQLKHGGPGSHQGLRVLGTKKKLSFNISLRPRQEYYWEGP